MVVARKIRFQTMDLALRSPKVEVFSLCWISSKRGCCHFPVGAFEATTSTVVVVGVLTVERVAMIGVCLFFRLVAKMIRSLMWTANCDECQLQESHGHIHGQSFHDDL